MRWWNHSRFLGMAALVPCAMGTKAAASPPSAAPPFRLEALVDFVDDIQRCARPLTAVDIDALMARLAERGIRRVSWSYYADERGGFLVPTGYVGRNVGWKNYEATYRLLGNPLKVAVAAGHRHGLEVYAYFKPYETGPAMSFPVGSPPAREWGRLDIIGGKLCWIDPFVAAHPELRIQRRSDDIAPGTATAIVGALRLTKEDARPTRLTAGHIQIWASSTNFHYHPLAVKFTLTEAVQPALREVRDQRGKLLTRRGDPVRVLTLSGLHLADKYLLVTTDFADGSGDFSNSGLSLLTAYDEKGREIPGVIASGSTIWCPELVDFRHAGVMFDYGWGARRVTLDAANAGGKLGFIAFARGRNAYLPGALCEAEPAVREFWLKCLDAMIATGVDGVDFREESHSTHTDHPEDYGFNPVILAAVQNRQGDLLNTIAAVRGEAYTTFLRDCRRRLAQAGKKMRYNLQLDFFRPNPPPERLLAYPANVRFDWRGWVRDGLMDESILRFFSLSMDAVFGDAVAQDMIGECGRRGIPICVNRYVNRAGDGLAGEVQRVRLDGRFDGFIFYEVSGYISFGKNPGECRIIDPSVLQAAPEVPRRL